MPAQTQASHLTEVEAVLRQRFSKEDADRQRVPSTARAAAGSARVDQLVLPDSERARMPLTKDKYLVKENPHLVAWEREVRKFLRNLSPDHGHRVAAVMIYEWATGIRIVDLMQAEQDDPAGERPPWRADLRKINKILGHHFGKPYMTCIAGRKVPKAYRIPPGWLVRRHRPLTLTLWAEYQAGTLYP
jgi:hypothetical protein